MLPLLNLPNSLFFGVLLSFMLALLPYHGPATAEELSQEAEREQALTLFGQALESIQRFSLRKDSPRDIVAKALQAYLKATDPYAEFIPAAEAANEDGIESGEAYGMGMEVFRTDDGRFLCIPHPGSPASISGVTYRDRLVAIDGKPLSGVSPPDVGLLLRGPNRSQVVLTLQDRTGRLRNIPAMRGKLPSRTVYHNSNGDLTMIRIIRFTKRTSEELRSALISTSGQAPIVIDLRGNMGGSFLSAVRSASLLLGQGVPIAGQKTSLDSPVQFIHNHVTALNETSRLIVWQDGLTGSAAEVFLAALLDNGRAESLGHTSYGKGLSQKLVRLGDGSVLRLTTALLVRPSGECVQKKGISPTHEMVLPEPDSKDYFRETFQLLNLRPAQ